MTPRVRAGFYGVYVALAAFTLMAGVFLVAVAGSKFHTEQETAPEPLTAWSNARVLSELGEAAQVMDCQPIAGVEGLTARVFVDQAHERLIVVCTAAQ